MRHVRLASSVLLFALALSPALGQPKGGGGGAPPPPAPAGPYKVIPVTPPKPFGDASLEAFRNKVADVAKRKDRAGLAALVVAKGFFWQREDGKPADPKKSSVDNLALALGLDQKDGTGWETLAGFAADPTAEPVQQMKGVMCSPASATFNDKDFEAVVKATKTDPSDWAYPATAGLEMRAKGEAAAPVVEKLGMNLIRVLPEEGEWAHVVAPSGKTGFVPGDSLSPLANDQLCYIKDGGGWHIAGYAGGGAQQ